MMMRSVLLFGLFLVSLISGLEDTHENCAQWAEMGECERNPGFMRPNCGSSCERVEAARAKQMESLRSIRSFYDLQAPDIDGNMLEFEELRGYVVVLTNVASYCGYTESHYRGLVELWSEMQDKRVRILAFPCNQFGNQEPGTAAEIKAFAKHKGVSFTMMEKIDVNGPNTSLVYLYLKQETHTQDIAWNFATYFVVQDDNVEAYHHVEPMQLQDEILAKLSKQEEL